MRYFVTGASGWIGSAAVPELIGAGHEVVGLARSDESASKLRAAGAEVQSGSLDDLDALRDAASASDGVIHLAFKHDLAFTGDMEGAGVADRAAIEVFGDALAGSDRPLVIASGTVGLKPGDVLTEDETHIAELAEHPRVKAADAALALTDRGVRSVVVRLAPTVHGDGDNGFMSLLVTTAREKGVSGYIGDGANRWPAVHRLDAAKLFRLAAEQAPAGSVLHGTAEEGVTLKAVAEVVGRHLDVPVRSIAPQDAEEHFGWLGWFLGLDAPVSSTATQELVGWKPTHQTLIDDLEAGHYF